MQLNTNKYPAHTLAHFIGTLYMKNYFVCCAFPKIDSEYLIQVPGTQTGISTGHFFRLHEVRILEEVR